MAASFILGLLATAALAVVAIVSVGIVLRPERYWRYLFMGRSEETLRKIAQVPIPMWVVRVCGAVLLLAALIGLWFFRATLVATQ